MFPRTFPSQQPEANCLREPLTIAGELPRAEDRKLLASGCWQWWRSLSLRCWRGQTSQPCTAADKWAKSIAAFDEQDKTSPPPKDAVLFVGSSSIRLWDTAQAFPDLPTINRGFGGSQMSDAARHAPPADQRV